MRVVVTGAEGFIGKNLVSLKGVEWVPTHHSKTEAALALDVTNLSQVKKVMETTNPDAVVHLAAMTNVDGCETEWKKAWLVNALSCKNLRDSAGDRPIVYLSTDYIFDGEDGPYTEAATPRPLNYYGFSKLAGELLLPEASPVIRICVPYGAGRYNFAMWLYSQLKDNKPVRLVNDQFNTPVYVDDISKAIVYMLQNKTRGILHVSPDSFCSRYEMGLELADVFGFDKSLISPCSSEDLNQVATRPRKAGLISDKTTKLSLTFLSLRDGLREMKSKLEAKI